MQIFFFSVPFIRLKQRNEILSYKRKLSERCVCFTACEFGVLLYFAFVFDVVIVIAVSQIQLKAENDNGGHQ